MDDTLAYEQDIKACFADIVGPRGLGKAAFEAELSSAEGALDSLREMHDGASLPLLRLPETRDDLPMIEARAAYHRERADDVVVLGTGGSSLGGQALYALADAGFGPSGGAPRLHFLDNVDPHSFDHLFRSMDFSRTDFLVVSKSGGTAETLCQFLICLQALIDAVGETAAADHVTVITEHRDSPLRQIAERFDFTVLEHDPALGGRFSVLSLVGLLPATIAGLDPARVREGAHEVLYRTLSARDPQHSDPALGAAINIGLWREQGIGTSVMMPYADSLGWLALWYRQLWAESLGKDGKGTLPVRAVGTVDQHSQLQLYLDGPNDKFFTFVLADVAGSGRTVSPALIAGDGLDYLAGRSMGDLLDAEQRATVETVIAHGRPTRILHTGRVDERCLGALMMHYMLETVIAAHLLQVDPFDQPAVEEGKILTRRYLAERPVHGD